jgi:hypothetical protein
MSLFIFLSIVSLPSTLSSVYCFLIAFTITTYCSFCAVEDLMRLKSPSPRRVRVWRGSPKVWKRTADDTTSHGIKPEHLRVYWKGTYTHRDIGTYTHTLFAYLTAYIYASMSHIPLYSPPDTCDCTSMLRAFIAYLKDFWSILYLCNVIITQETGPARNQLRTG